MPTTNPIAHLESRADIMSELGAELRQAGAPDLAAQAERGVAFLASGVQALHKLRDAERGGAVTAAESRRRQRAAIQAADETLKAMIESVQERLAPGVQGQNAVPEAVCAVLDGRDAQDVEREMGVGHQHSAHASRRRAFLNYLRG